MTGFHNARRRSISVLKNRAPKLAAAVLVALTSLPGTPAFAAHFGGPVILTSNDMENCSVAAHVRPVAPWIGVVQDGIFPNTTNGGDGILVIGAHPDPLGRRGPIGFWNEIGAGTGETITFGDENSSFAGYQMIAIVGSATQTCGGLTQTQNTVLTGRAADFAAFVNGGGGLIASSQLSFPAAERFGFIGGLDAVVTKPYGLNFRAIDPTPAGRAVGVNDTLDIPAWHFAFTGFPDFLEPLAYRAFSTTDIFAIGGARVIFPVTPGGEPPTDPPPPPPPPPSLLDGVTGLVGTVTGVVNPGPSPAPSPTPSPSPEPSPTAGAPADTTPPRDGSTGAVPIGGVKAGGGGTASGSGGRTAAIMLVLLAAVAHFVFFVRRKAGTV